MMLTEAEVSDGSPAEMSPEKQFVLVTMFHSKCCSVATQRFCVWKFPHFLSFLSMMDVYIVHVGCVPPLCLRSKKKSFACWFSAGVFRHVVYFRHRRFSLPGNFTH